MSFTDKKSVFARLIFLSLVLTSITTFAQKIELSTESYIKPPKNIEDIVNAPWHENYSLSRLSPDGKYFIIPQRTGMPTLEIYAKPYVNLGETEFDHNANRSRNFTLTRDKGFDIFDYNSGKKISVTAPENCWLSNMKWSLDASQIAYFVHSEKETHIYVYNLKNAKSVKISKSAALATNVTSFEWSSDGKNILCVLVPEKREPMPVKSSVATEPKIRMTGDSKVSTQTYPNLMQTPFDMKLYEWLITGQLALINVENKKAQNIGTPAMYRRINIAPDMKYLRLTITTKPFSYIVPVSNAGSIEGIYDLTGKLVYEINKTKLRLGDSDNPTEADNKNDKRSLDWRPDGNGISYLQLEPLPKAKKEDKKDEAKDETPEEPKPRKDRIIQWLPPYDSASVKIIYETKDRISSVQYSQDCQTIFISQTLKGKQNLTAIILSDTSKKYTIYSYKADDIYKNPGSLLTKEGKFGINVVRISIDNQFVYLSGTKYDKEPLKNAPRPFIDKVNIKSSEKKRIFESEADVYETVSDYVDDNLTQIITDRQSPKVIGDSYLRNLADGSLKKLTNNKDFVPQITNAVKKRIVVQRTDGFKFKVNITLPENFKEGSKLPAVFWFYPSEFTDQKAYDKGEERYNKNSFQRVGSRSASIFTQLGYAVVEPDCPIVGKANQMNDNYIPDLRNNLWAVIDSLDKMGYINRDKLAIGGHSYGAFSTAHAMIQTPFFKAGIAGDGNYNRTLTPATFQSERRNMWEARETYLNMSPILYANQLSGALLMYHGIDDANVGTFLINSERMFHALNALGKTTALYMYPYEHHGPATKETHLDLWARWTAWLDKYVMNPEKKVKKDDKDKKEETDKK